MKWAWEEEGYMNGLPCSFPMAFTELLVEGIENWMNNCRHCNRDLTEDDTLVCGECFDKFEKPFIASERPTAKSSSMTLRANACQTCGCLRDGKDMKPGCKCRCHR